MDLYYKPREGGYLVRVPVGGLVDILTLGDWSTALAVEVCARPIFIDVSSSAQQTKFKGSTYDDPDLLKFDRGLSTATRHNEVPEWHVCSFDSIVTHDHS